MALEPGPRRSMSPDSSGRASPNPRQWRNQLSAGSDDSSTSKDKNYRKYASGVERSLSLFETALQEWADYISCLSRLLKALQARPPTIATVPSKALVSKRLAQCLNPSLPSGVHQKALEVYRYIFSFIGSDNLSRDLPLYLPGLATVLSFASLTVRGPFLDLLETYVLKVDAHALRPALKALVLALLPGLEEETSEDFDRTLKLVENFKIAVRDPRSKELSEVHSTGDDFFWQCFFLATITGHTRRTGALAYLVRFLPRLGPADGKTDDATDGLAELVTSPEPGLLLRCFASGLLDEQLLIQRGFLDLLVTHLPLHSRILQTKVKHDDIELLLQTAVGVVTRRDMSLNRRLWAWFLGPEPTSNDHDASPDSPASTAEPTPGFLASKTSYFEEYGLHSLSQALLSMIKSSAAGAPAERAKPYRICLSLMDRWEIGGLVVPEVFLPVITSVKDFKSQAATKADFNEVLRSASVFFDGVESGLIYGELVGLVAQALAPGNTAVDKRLESLSLVQFIMAHFNIREEEMVTIHAPLAALAVVAMLEDVQDRDKDPKRTVGALPESLISQALEIVLQLADLIPDRAFPLKSGRENSTASVDAPVLASTTNNELLKRIRAFYMSEQGSLEAGPIPFSTRSTGQMLLQKVSILTCKSFVAELPAASTSIRSRLLLLILSKAPREYPIETGELLQAVHARLSAEDVMEFLSFKSMLSISTQLYAEERITSSQLAKLVPSLVKHAWAFLSLSNPKYHVEAVRGLWHLQSALSLSDHEIEAVLTDLMTKEDSVGTFAVRHADPGRSFSILWTHTLQDNPSHFDRRGLRSPTLEIKPSLRLAGMDHYKVMLTRPLFSMLDALHDERTQLFMAAKMWLGNMVGIEKLFLIFIDKFAALTFLCGPRTSVKSTGAMSKVFDDEADIDLAVYFLRTLSNVLRWAPEAFWGVLATRVIEHPDPNLIQITGSEGGFSLLEFFLHLCLRCVAGDIADSDGEQRVALAQLHRSALSLLQQLLASPHEEPLRKLNIQDLLSARLLQSLTGSDPYTQVMLMDVVVSAIKLQVPEQDEVPLSPTGEKRSLHQASVSMRPSATSTVPAQERNPVPASLLHCIQAALVSPNSRSVLDSWVALLAEVLPLYSRSIFQVLIPLVETLCTQVANTFDTLQDTFREPDLDTEVTSAPETTLISLLNALEQVLAKAHECLLVEESRSVVVKSPDQPQGFFGNMVSGVFNSEQQQTRSATANDRLTVLLAFQDAVRICFRIWSWGQGSEASTLDANSAASFNYTSLRMRNRARRLLEHVFAAEALECLETVVGIWRASLNDTDATKHSAVFSLLPVLDGSRPVNTIPAIFNAIYSRSNPGALEASRKSTLTISLQDTDLVIFLVDYAKSLEDDAMDEIWQDCMTFLRDLLTNPFPHRQTLPSLLKFAAILGEKVDNTNFGEQKRMRRELGDIFLRLLTALFTTRPTTFADASSNDKEKNGKSAQLPTSSPQYRADDVVGILAQIVPSLPKILVESDRVLTAAGTISANVVGPSIRSKGFPDTVSKSMLTLLYELTRLQNNQKTWKKDIGDAFNDSRFFSANTELVQSDWLPLLHQWARSDKERITEILSRITPPTTAGIVFGVGATSARLEADRKTQLNLRRIATLIMASGIDVFVADLPAILERLVELLAATATSSPSSTTRAEIYMVIRALTLRTSAVHLSPLWPIVNSELHEAISSVVATGNGPSADTFNTSSILQACKLLDVLVAVAPDDFQLHEWLFVTDTIDAIYRSPSYQPVALVDELSEELGTSLATHSQALHAESGTSGAATSGPHRRPLLGPGGIDVDVSFENKAELVAKILRPFFGQLSIFLFESTYAMSTLDEEWCVASLLRDLFDERSIVKAL